MTSISYRLMSEEWGYTKSKQGWEHKPICLLNIRINSALRPAGQEIMIELTSDTQKVAHWSRYLKTQIIIILLHFGYEWRRIFWNFITICDLLYKWERFFCSLVNEVSISLVIEKELRIAISSIIDKIYTKKQAWTSH